MARWRGWWTATCGGAAPVIACEGGASEVRSTPELLEEARGGQLAHRSQQIDDEHVRQPYSPGRGKRGNHRGTVGSLGRWCCW
jgi:hypothetical protein